MSKELEPEKRRRKRRRSRDIKSRVYHIKERAVIEFEHDGKRAREAVKLILGPGVRCRLVKVV